jgi:mono/diheme cytochrome c family protein
MRFAFNDAPSAIALLGAFGLSLALSSAAVAAGKPDPLAARGKYLVTIGGCNDCHTEGYESGKVPVKEWLQGSALGWNGPWGTTYPINLRNYFSKISEADWVATAKKLEARPPMPAINVRQMGERDLKAIYHFIRALGPAGGEAPAYLPPDKTPPLPFVQFHLPPPPPKKP